MNNYKFILILIINYLILISNCSTISFSTTIDCITTPCVWSNVANWVGGILPVEGDDVIIDIGSKAIVTCNPEDLINKNFKSVLINSNLKVLNSNLGGVISNIQVNQGKIIIESPKVSLSNISGSSGSLILDLITTQDEAYTTQLSSISLNLVQICQGPIRVGISSSTINTISEMKSAYLNNNSLPMISFTSSNSIGLLNLQGDGVSFNDGPFILNGDLNKVSNVISSFGDTQNDTIALNGKVTFSKVSISTQSPFTFSSSISIIGSTINSPQFTSIDGSSSSLTIDGSNTLNTNITLTGSSSSLVVLSTIKQTNIAGSLILSGNSIFSTVGTGSPLVTANVITINTGSTLKIQLENEPTQGKYKLFKGISQLGGTFDTISFTIDNKEVDSEKYNISSSDGSYSITYGSLDDNSSSSKITSNSILLLLSILILNLF